MYRVELKAFFVRLLDAHISLFLMYRVELKVFEFVHLFPSFFVVPNVPCGVESKVL